MGDDGERRAAEWKRGGGLADCGWDKTFRVLRDTANEAAVPVLLAAFNSSGEAIQEKALRDDPGSQSGCGAGGVDGPLARVG